MPCVLNLHKILSTLAVSSNNFFFGTSVRAGNLCFCLLFNTSAIYSVIATSSSIRLLISSSASNDVKISLFSSPKLLPVSSAPLSSSLQLSFSATFLSSSSISHSAIQLFLQIVFAWSTSLCSDAGNIPLFNRKLSMCFL